MPSIFERISLKPTQLRTVAERRFDDARYLCDSGWNRHANGVLYLGGFVLECLLKAKLMERYAMLLSPGRRANWSRHDHRRYDLCYRWHDLASILEELPDVLQSISSKDSSGRLTRSLRALCGEWTVFARYSPRTATMMEARKFLLQIEELKSWLR